MPSSIKLIGISLTARITVQDDRSSEIVAPTSIYSWSENMRIGDGCKNTSIPLFTNLFTSVGVSGTRASHSFLSYLLIPSRIVFIVYKFYNILRLKATHVKHIV